MLSKASLCHRSRDRATPARPHLQAKGEEKSSFGALGDAYLCPFDSAVPIISNQAVIQGFQRV
jgi:hypothetical protein